METLLQNEDTLYFIEDFIAEDEAQAHHLRLFKELEWHEEPLESTVQRLPMPYLTCWYGDLWLDYIYGGVSHQPQDWLPLLLTLRAKVEQQTKQSFNGVLATQYRDENDCMGWHSNDDTGLGVEPWIAVLHLGEKRLFMARNKDTAAMLEVMMSSGSLLVMAGQFQQHWRHGIAGATVSKRNSISLSFRKIVAV